MSTPKKRQTKSSRRMRASHFALSLKKSNTCPQCKKAVLPHHACSYCGTYGNKKVLKTKADKKIKIF